MYFVCSATFRAAGVDVIVATALKCWGMYVGEQSELVETACLCKPTNAPAVSSPHLVHAQAVVVFAACSHQLQTTLQLLCGSNSVHQSAATWQCTVHGTMIMTDMVMT